MDVSIIGTGYVGLVTGLGLAKAGHRVALVDRRKEVVEKINRGIAPFFEPGLDGLLSFALAGKLARATDNLEEAVQKSDITLICVGTPSDAQGRVDLSDINSAALQIGRCLKNKQGFHTVVVKSTVVPGSTHKIGKIISGQSGKKAGIGFGLAMNPEFLREGCAVQDVSFPDRIVVGADDEKSSKELHRLYESSEAPKLDVGITTAEMIKYANNSFLALCISFSNEISQICERLDGVNAYDVMRGVALDGRLSTRQGGKIEYCGAASYLVPGCGFGGSCFPKDVSALAEFSVSNGYAPRLVKGTLEINREQAGLAVAKLRAALDGLGGKRIAVLGVAFKPDTDDIRESPSLRIIDGLLAEGAAVAATDPKALANARKAYGEKISYCENWEDALRGADAAVLVTKWAEFSKISPATFKSLLARPLLLDCRGLYDAKKYSGELEYRLLGLKNGVFASKS